MNIKRIRNWDTIKNNSGYYNSVMDEINRNYNLTKKIKVNDDLNMVFKKILAAIHQSYNLNKKLDNGLEFSFQSKDEKENKSTITYKIENFEFNKFIVMKWTKNDNHYWTEFLFKQKNKKVVIKYSESVLKKYTISGIQGMIDTSWYKVNFRKSFKKWNGLLALNDKKINKINLQINNLQNKIDKLYQESKFIEANEIIKKYMGKKRLDMQQLNQYKVAKNYIEKINKKANKIQRKLIITKNGLFLIKDEWVNFVSQNYNF